MVDGGGGGGWRISCVYSGDNLNVIADWKYLSLSLSLSLCSRCVQIAEPTLSLTPNCDCDPALLWSRYTQT